VSRDSSTPIDQTSLDLLQSENLILGDLFDQIDEHRGPSVEDRYDYGNLAKRVINHLALRQSALMNVATAILPIPELHLTGIRMKDRGTTRRVDFDEVGDLARDVSVMDLNQGQDFDGPLGTLIEAASREMDWELSEAIPLIRRSLNAENLDSLFSSAQYIRHHAPTTLSTSGPRWYEHAPIISRVLTVFGHMKNYMATDHYRGRS